MCTGLVVSQSGLIRGHMLDCLDTNTLVLAGALICRVIGKANYGPCTFKHTFDTWQQNIIYLKILLIRAASFILQCTQNESKTNYCC